TAGFLMQEPDVGTAHRLALAVTDLYGRAYADTFELRPPMPPGSVSGDASLGPHRLQITWDTGGSADVAHYNVYRSLAPGGPYTRVNADPVTHTVFLDLGLAGTTKYYYEVTAIDSSGNESAASPAASASTNPQQAPAWPLELLLETVSSVVVGDIDGDGDLEIVVGDQYVYAWHHDGLELIDGDGDALTWGVLNTLGENYVSHIALARIDPVPGLDIVAASRATKEVYVFDYTGAPLPGWPQTLEYAIRAGVAVGDLDGDFALDIVAVDERGVLYAWDDSGVEKIDGDANPLTPGVFRRLPGVVFQYSTPALADLDGDGSDEIIIATEADSIYVFDGSGALLPGWPYPLGSDAGGSPAVGDIDDDGDLEIVVNSLVGTVRALHHDGTLLWSRWLANNTFFGPSPALGDVDGDGKLDTFIPSSDGKLYGLDHAGADLPGWPVVYSTTTYAESSPVIADIDGDGAVDIALGYEDRLIKGWHASGTALDGFPLTMGDALRGVPTVTDVDGDGDVDLVAAGWDKNVYVWDFPGAYDESKCPWPGFHANVHNDGLIWRWIPTGVLGAAFSYEVVGRGVALEWRVSAEAGYSFDVERAEVSGSQAEGRFERVARGLGAPFGTVRWVDTGVEMGGRYAYRLVATGAGGSASEAVWVYVPVGRAQLGQNHPNPFNPTTRIAYWVPEGPAVPVRLEVYDVRGARVRVLVDGERPGGRYEATWDGRDAGGARVSSGVYFYRMMQPGYRETRKMLLLK
ncbi:MAG: FG-GAP-like repeat-containing protein, partial [Candidatus Krumholzibacteria bacterium]|nr:FG-GAP-like repeat-containing protein [Candidatus Krumholzibacteria bacterium]